MGTISQNVHRNKMTITMKDCVLIDLYLIFEHMLLHILY